MTIQGLLRLRPQRVFALCPSRKPRLLAASDAAQDGVCLGSAGALAVTPCQHRLALVLPVNDRLLQWDSQAAKISQLELCIIMMALANLAPWVRGHRGVWFIDNVPALMSLTKGRSSTHELDVMAGIVHSILCGLNCWWLARTTGPTAFHGTVWLIHGSHGTDSTLLSLNRF